MTKVIYIGNLPLDISQEQMRNLFRSVCKVDLLKMVYRDGEFLGYCFVKLSESMAAKAIRELHGYSFNDSVLVVQEAKRKKKGHPNSYQGMYEFRRPSS